MSLLDLSEASILEPQQVQEPTLDNAVSHNLLIECLKKNKKKAEDCEWIYETIKDLDFFKNLFASSQSENNTKILLELCTNMSYENVKAGNFVFRQGDDSNHKFYVILRGQVGVVSEKSSKPVWPSRANTTAKPQAHSMITLPENSDQKDESENTKSDENTRPTVTRKATLRFGDNFGTTVAMTMAVKKVAQKARFLLRTRNNNVQSLPNVDDEQNLERDFKEQAESYGQLIRVLSPGNDFGDAAFKKPGHKRTASILCKTDCELLVINTTSYINFLTAIRDKKNQFLLSTFAFLNSISSSQIQYRIFYSFFSEGFNEGTKLTDEGQKLPNPKIYLIEYGSCKVQRKLECQIKNPCNHSEVVHKQTQWLTLCVVGPGTLIGEETLFYPRNQEQYEYRTIVTSKRMSAMSITKQVFINLHPEMKEHVQKFYKVKKDQRDEVYERLSKESLAQREDNSHQFLKKHAGLMRMVNKKALNFFTGRENRTFSKHATASLGSQLTQPQSVTPDSVEMQQKSLINQSYLTYTHHTFGLKSESMNELNENKPKPRRTATIGSEQDLDQQLTVPKHPISTKPLPESSENISFNKISRDNYQKGHNSKLDRAKSLNFMLYAAEQPSIMRYDSQGANANDNPSEQAVPNSDDFTHPESVNKQKNTTFTSSQNVMSSKFPKMQTNQSVHLPITYTKGLVQQLSTDKVQSIEGLQRSQIQASPVVGNKVRSLRLTSSSQILDSSAPRFRDSLYERSYNNFLANFKSPEPQNPEDIEQFRFVFNDNADTQKRNKLRKMALARSQHFSSFSHRYQHDVGKENSTPEVNESNKRDQKSIKQRTSSKESERCNSKTPSLVSLVATQNSKPMLEGQKQEFFERNVNTNNSHITTHATATLGISNVLSGRDVDALGSKNTITAIPEQTNQRSEQDKKMLQFKAKIQEISNLQRATRKRIQNQNCSTVESRSYVQDSAQGNILLPKFHNSVTRKNALHNYSVTSLVIDNQS